MCPNGIINDSHASPNKSPILGVHKKFHVHTNRSGNTPNNQNIATAACQVIY
jgi:hypothetical protein